MDTVKQQEENYLQMLRRVALGLAKAILVLVTLAVLYAAYQGAEGVYHWLDGSRSHLPSQSELLQRVNPCSYLTNTAPNSNGRDDNGWIAVRQVLKSCQVGKQEAIKFKTSEEALAAGVNEIIATVTQTFQREYQDETATRSSLLKMLEGASQEAVAPVSNSDLYSESDTNSLKLDVATAIAAHFAMTRHVLIPSQLAVSDEVAFQHAFDTRFVVNQISVGLDTAVRERNAAKTSSTVAFASAVGLLWNAAQLFAAFLALMFLFLFIKYELHLRDINNSIASRGLPPTS